MRHIYFVFAVLLLTWQRGYAQCSPEYQFPCLNAFTGSKMCTSPNANLDNVIKCHFPISICIQEDYNDKQRHLFSDDICPFESSDNYDIFKMIRTASINASALLHAICPSVELNIEYLSKCNAGYRGQVPVRLVTDNSKIFPDEKSSVIAETSQITDTDSSGPYLLTTKININGMPSAMADGLHRYCYSTNCDTYLPNPADTGIICKNLTQVMLHEFLHILLGPLQHINDCMSEAQYPYIKNEAFYHAQTKDNFSSGNTITPWLCCVVRAMYCPGMGKLSNDPCPDPNSVVPPRLQSYLIPTVLAYPNPAQHSINVMLFSHCAIGVLTVYNENGIVIEERRISEIYDNSGSLSIDTQNYVSGVYYVVFTDANGIGSKRISIVH